MYNEEDNVLITLEEVKKVLKTYDSYQILAVNDGSGDQTLQLLEEFAKENPELEVLSTLLIWEWEEHLEQGLKRQKVI
jgi:glycosyltransferase involved in cell wall biosynthesis